MLKQFICALLLISLVNLFVPVTVLADEEDAILVKIGYSENYGMIKKPTFEGYEGYGYEYLHKISEYTENNYKFEFVECSILDGIEMLRNNEIQILAPMNQTPDREKEFVFSTQIFGKEAMFLTSITGETINENNYKELNNSDIAVQVGDITIQKLNTILAENNIKANVVEVNPSELPGDYDYFLSDSMQMDLELDTAVNLGTNNTYLMGNKQSQKIINDFDKAMELITKNEYLYKEQLYVKYFNYTMHDYLQITAEEYQTLIDNGPYNVGVTSTYTSFGYDEIQEIAGLPYDIVNMLVEQSGMEVIFHKITDTTISKMKDDFDFYLNPIGYADSSDKRTSEPYLKTPVLYINNVEEMNKNGKTGVIYSYMLEPDVLQYLAPNKKIITYDGIEELCKAFKKGYVDSILIVESSYSNAYNIIQNIPHTIEASDYEFFARITFSDEFPQENIDIINKMVTYIDSDAIEIANIRNSSLLSEADKSNFVNIYLRAFIILGIIVVVIVVQTNNNRYKELERLSSFDELTGLYTQKKFIEETRIILDNNSNFNYTLMIIDIDNFKYINEIYSYEVGSNILKKIANIVQTVINDDLPTARISADNFLLLVSTNGLLSKIHSNLKTDNPLYTEINELVSEHYSINFSVGSYDIVDKSLDVSYMIDCCSLAHSFSKMELGTTYKAFSEDMKTKETTKNSIISRMNQALKDKEFVIFYQPKFDIFTKKITGAEGLVRWFSNGSMIPPNDFIPLFEQNGFIENLDYYVVERACEFIKENPDKELPVLSVNLSGITIMKSDVVSRIMEIVNRHKIDPSQIDLEITESAFVDHFEMAIESIDKFRELGFTISMDDFGAGISSLNRLKEISIDILKIDREFIVGSLENEKGSTIIRNIILMAKDLRLETVAEGIETDEQLNFLRNLGCDIGQGYYFSRPLPEQDFLKKLEE